VRQFPHVPEARRCRAGSGDERRCHAMVRRVASWMGESAVAMLLAVCAIALSMPVTTVEAALR
jgi:hypothetical protein